MYISFKFNSKKVDLIYIWIYENSVKEIAPCSSTFYYQSLNDIKIIKECLSAFLKFSSLSYLPCLALLSIMFFFFIAWSDLKAFWSCKIKVHMAVLVQSMDTIFINPVLYMYTCKRTC